MREKSGRRETPSRRLELLGYKSIDSVKKEQKHLLPVRFPSSVLEYIEQESEKSGRSLAAVTRDLVFRGIKEVEEKWK